MKFILSFLFVSVCVAANAQTIKNNLVVIGKTDSVRSRILNEERTVWIYLPAAYDASGKTRYPVIYLLDAEWNFAAFSGMVHELSEVIGNTVLPPVIIVAIPNTDRNRDLTPTNSILQPNGSKDPGLGTSGGGEKFTTFIKTELMPHIDSAYHTSPYKMLVGHSFGGITAVNILLNHSEMFNSYMVIDPSMWWDKRKLLNEAREVLKQKKFDGKMLFLGIANTMPGGMDTARVQKDTSGRTMHIRSILELKNILQHNPQNGLEWTYNYYNADTHGTVPLIAEYDALHFMFSFYKMTPAFTAQMTDPHSTTDVPALLSSHYDNISKHMGYKILPPEDLLTGLGHYFLDVNAAGKALSLFSFDIANYPDSDRGYNNMGDYYDRQKNKEKAIEYYTKALKIKDDPDTKKKLDKLLKEGH